MGATVSDFLGYDYFIQFFEFDLARIFKLFFP